MPSKNTQALQFTNETENEALHFVYQNKANSPELVDLTTKYQLDSIADLEKTEFDKVLPC